MKSIREEYLRNGVEGYYKHIKDYSNPHIEQIKELLIRNIGRIKLDNILDMCCGSGEVTKILLNNGINDIKGSDKYTQSIYTKNTEKLCLDLSFKDILARKLSGNFSTIICSFALHLVDEKDLRMITYELFNHTENLIIISPHKRPFLDKLPNVKLVHKDFSLTSKGKKVHLRIYKII
jgi:2-polyprenyl-3-methyl-5-hydroxy-6-metoxy-1,4-benzoquinol methylase